MLASGRDPSASAGAGTSAALGVAIAASNAPASRTLRANGPAVSKLAAIGMMPRASTTPSVGLMPTTPLTLAGETMDPSVSVPTASGARRAAAATAEPLEDPDGL